jgi:hypothetical protein
MFRHLFNRRKTRGQAALFATMSLVVSLGAVGLVVDTGWAYWRKQAARAAAESASTAAVMAAVAATTSVGYTCGLTVSCVDPTACPAAPTAPPSTVLQSGCLYAQANGFVNTGNQTVTYRSGTTGSPVPGVSPAYWISFTVTENNRQLFSSVLGKTWGQIQARSTSGIFLDPQGACIYALDPHDNASFSTVGTADVHSSCGVYVDSDDPSAITVSGGGVVNASVVKVVGGYNTNGGGILTPVPATGQAVTPDPFAALPAPVVPNRCDSNGINGTATPTPNATDHMYVICGDIRLTGNATQTFAPGIYIVKNGGITWNNGHVRGTGVTFYMTADTPNQYTAVSIAGNEDVQLSAPSSGTYRGVLFFQDRNLPTSAAGSNFLGGSTQILNGSLYFPTTLITYTGGNNTTASYTGLVGYEIAFKGTSYFTADTNGIHTGLGLPKVGLFE